MTELAERLEARAHDAIGPYAPGRDRPLGAYVAIMAANAALAAGLAFAGRRRGARLPERIGAADVALFGIATHKLSRVLTKELVTSPLRAPFTRLEGSAGPAELAERPRGHGLRKALGELLTCPFCLGEWIAGAHVAGAVFAPRLTRLLSSVFAVLAVSDWLQLGHARLSAAPPTPSQSPAH